jgi:hypothetical protein
MANKTITYTVSFTPTLIDNARPLLSFEGKPVKEVELYQGFALTTFGFSNALTEIVKTKLNLKQLSTDLNIISTTEFIEEPNLKILGLSDSYNLTEIKNISTFTKLEYLTISNCNFTIDSLDAIISHLLTCSFNNGNFNCSGQLTGQTPSPSLVTQLQTKGWEVYV